MVQTVSFRGSKSRNKVSVGEPSEGSYSSLKVGSMVAGIRAATITRHKRVPAKASKQALVGKGTLGLQLEEDSS